MATITNISTGETIATDARIAANPWSRFRGLMLRSRLRPGEALDIRGESSIHMMFMRFRIDAVFYDADGRVLRVARSLRPWTGMAFGKGARGVIELADGAAANVEPGHELRLAA
jgi:hypothetical protein